MNKSVYAVLYVRDYKRDEQQLLQEKGLPTYRWNPTEPFPESLADDGHSWLIRAGRLTKNEFRNFWGLLDGYHVALVTSLRSFEIMDDFELHYPLISDMTPPAIVLPADVGSVGLLESVRGRGLVFPVFVRSDIESAAKFVGVDGCVLTLDDLSQADRILTNLRTHVRGIRKIIVKEVLPIRQSQSNTPLEYRAIGIAGSLVTFDYDPLTVMLPPPSTFDLVAAANAAFRKLSVGGANGAMFVDLAITQDGRPSVVECKDFSNGSIGCSGVFATALRLFSRGGS